MRRRVGILRSVARTLALLVVAAFVLPISPTHSQGTVQTYSLPTISLPQGVTAGPDGNLWFTEALGNKIGRITPTGMITEFNIPTAGSNPNGIAAGPDGNMWFTESDGNKIGRILTAAPNTITEFTIPTAASGPLGIAAGSDAMWFTESAANKIGKILTAAPNTITEFTIPTAASGPSRITAGPDSAFWFTESAASANKIGRIPTTATSGAPGIQEFNVAAPATGLGGITLGPDGNLWATAFGSVLVAGSARILQITPQGQITPFIDPNITSPGSIARGSDGALWFAQSLANTIGRISVTGAVSVVVLTPPDIFPGEITAGPPADGGLWFTQPFMSRIGKVAVGGGGGAGTLNGTIIPQGLPVGQRAVPLEVRLLQPGTETQVGSSFNVTSAANGSFTVSNIPAGTYDVDVKNPQRLSRRQFGVTFGTGPVSRDFGTALAGDVLNDNEIELQDAARARAAFGTLQGQPNFNASADFNNDGEIDLSDFALIRANFGQLGQTTAALGPARAPVAPR